MGELAGRGSVAVAVGIGNSHHIFLVLVSNPHILSDLVSPVCVIFTESASLRQSSHRVAMSVCVCVCVFMCAIGCIFTTSAYWANLV